MDKAMDKHNEKGPAFTVRIPQKVRVPAITRAAEKQVSLGRVVIDFLEDFGAGLAEQYPKDREAEHTPAQR